MAQVEKDSMQKKHYGIIREKFGRDLYREVAHLSMLTYINTISSSIVDCTFESYCVKFLVSLRQFV